jgi:hypothetical protein
MNIRTLEAKPQHFCMFESTPISCNNMVDAQTCDMGITLASSTVLFHSITYRILKPMFKLPTYAYKTENEIH